jgi:RNA-binding protein
MLNSKQRAWLRSQANPMDCQFHIGKGEINETLLRGLDEIMTTHELLKVNVLKAAEETPAEIAAATAEAIGAEVVQVIGRRFVLYRFSPKLAKAGKSLALPY